MSMQDLLPVAWQLGVTALGLILLLLPATNRQTGKYKVVEHGPAFAPGGLGFRGIGLLLVVFGGWRLYQDYWLVHHPTIPSDLAEWKEVRTADGVLTTKFPAPATHVSGAAGGAWTLAMGKGVHFAVVERQVAPGTGFVQPQGLAAFYQGIAAAPAEAQLGTGKVIRQEPVRTDATTGSRVGLDFPDGSRFFVQSYRVANRLLAVSMYGPVSLFEEGTAKKFFDTVELDEPAIAPTPAAPTPRLSAPRPGNDNKTPERRFGPKPGVKGVGDR